MNIYLLAIIFLVPALAMVCMTVMIVCRDYRNNLYRAAGRMFAVAALNFMAMFFMNSAPLHHRASILLYILFPLITLLLVSVLHYWFLYTRAYEKRHARWYKALIAAFLVQLLSIPFVSSTGYVGLRSDGSVFYEPGPGMYAFWGLTFVALGTILRLFIPLFRREPGPARILLTAMLLATGFGVGINVASILFQSQQYYLDKLTTHSMIFAMVGIYINMVKYNDLPSFEKRYRILFERAPLGILIVDGQGAIREASPAALDILNLPASSSDIMHNVPETKREAWLRDYEAAFRAQTRMQNTELMLSAALGMNRTIAMDSEFIVVGGETLQFIMIRDITEMKHNERQITYLAYHDGLTGLYNRAAFQRELDRLLSVSASCSLILMDLNKFKAINDNYGHHAGDLALCHVAAKLSEAAGPAEFVARFAGDEFVVLTAGQEEADRFLAKLAQAQEASPFRLAADGEHIEVTLSVGISHYPRDGENADDLYKRADERMYRMKKQPAAVSD
ncbi:GGDEF domain-containing protein [Paenibacillus methanolicus]|uniref:PAS domain S-box-containing protein/diguanylate cyclase (GGDEF)-like protein n=1 Tax=Paenibacillus methanolicus TaxID=582686 RepID=A0A5S5C7C8_9BACL|nr:sensor domain-containing diguanylate cyclase [Paenibacillus methanolicus]TYP74508.1 PAS domain S-box-containing protein/diguanylate cyclase (GGDEF)-like protein [Paenibacillus methanolicus]